jgi:Ca-activated chloride channel family protein
LGSVPRSSPVPAAALLLTALLCAPTAARSAPRDNKPVFGSGLDVVNVTVTVRDENGKLVSSLGPGDFTVFEDGRPQKVQLFGQAWQRGGEEANAELEERLSVNLGLLLDTSESMLKELKLSQEAAVRFLDSIPRARDLITIFFDRDIRLSRYDSENQQGLIRRIFEQKGGGQTALYDAIAVYVDRVAGSGGRKVLVLLTDGEDTTSTVSLAELMGLVRSSPVTIYPIAFTGGYSLGSGRYLAAKTVLNQLAEVSGGVVFSPQASKDLAAIYQRILDELGAQYVLGFVSDNARKDGKFRKLRVQVNRNDWKIRHRAGYYGPKPIKLAR